MLRNGLYSIALIASLCTAANASDIHRVVTSLDAANRSTTLLDSNVPLHGPGYPGAILWITDSSPPGFSQEDLGKWFVGLPPPNNGTVLRVFEFPPLDDAKVASMDPNSLMKVVGPTAPARGVPPSNPLVHRTRTVDYAIIMSGEIDMMLDDKTVHLKAGDVVVQQATNHAWLNHGKEPCRVQPLVAIRLLPTISSLTTNSLVQTLEIVRRETQFDRGAWLKCPSSRHAMRSAMSAFGSKADIARTCIDLRF